jgi:PAS domain S-box-containing protein
LGAQDYVTKPFIEDELRARVHNLISAQCAKNALRASEERFRLALSDSPAVVFEQDRDLRYTWIYNAAAPLTAQDALGRTDWDLLLAEEAEQLTRLKSRVLETGEGARESVRITLGSEVRYFDVRCDPRRAENGAVVGLTGVGWDVTERRRLEHQLRLSEATSSGILSTSADAIISIDEDQRITLFNDGAEKAFGYSKAEVIGSPLDMLIPERLRAIHRQHVDNFAAGEEVARRAEQRGLEILGLRKNGEEFPADAAISKLEVGGQKILTVALHDITERKRFEKEQCFLAQAGALLSSLDYEQTMATIATMAVGDFADWCGVDLVDEHEELMRLKVVSADPSQATLCARLERLPPDRQQHHLARAVIDMRRPILLAHVTRRDIETYAQGREHLEALLAVRATSAMAVPLLRHDHAIGVLVFVSSTASHVYGPRDVRFAEALAERAAVAIENARLYRAANRATQVRDDVLGVVAHDLRNPLATILLQASLLGAEPERRSRKAEETIERAANRMNRLIQDLLDVARMEAGQLSIERARLRTGELVSEALETQRPLAASASLELQLDLSSDLLDVWADRDRLQQVFENLIGNALKFTEPKGQITVGAAPWDGEALFWVADTGRGIASEDVPHLFDRYWQARRAGRRGAGLGLPIVKGIVEAHGGHIWVESTPGRGSTFFFTIPTAPGTKTWRHEPAPHGP